MTEPTNEGWNGIKFHDDGYRINVFKDGLLLGVVTEYKHAEYGHLFHDFLTEERAKAEARVRTQIRPFVERVRLDVDVIKCD